MAKTKLRAEMWDKMQFLFRRFYDRMIHIKYTYAGKIDPDVFRRVIEGVFEQAPILHSRFHYNILKPYWTVEEYSIGDVVVYKQNVDVEYESVMFFKKAIPYKNNVQMKIGLFYDGTKTVVVFLTNHMCIDGGDLKYLLKLISHNYNAIVRGEEDDLLPVKQGSRSYREIYSKLSPEDCKKAQNLWKYEEFGGKKVPFPYAKKTVKDENKILIHTLGKDLYEKVLTCAHENGATVNDVMLAAISIAIGKSVEKEPTLAVSSAIDLRRHIVDNASHTGLTNHTAWMNLKIENKCFDLSEKVKTIHNLTEKLKNDKFLGMYSLPLLRLGFEGFPYFLSEILIGIGYSNPYISVSNLGVIKKEDFSYDGTELIDVDMTGTTKYKPYFMLTFFTFNETIKMGFALKGNGEDERKLNEFFSTVDSVLSAYFSKKSAIPA